MVSYTTKNKKDLIIAGSILISVTAIYIPTITFVTDGNYTETNTQGDQIKNNFIKSVNPSSPYSIPTYLPLTAGIVSLSLGLAAKTI